MVTEENLLYPKWFLETFTEIKTKEQKILPFIFKPAQKKYYRESLVDEYGLLRRGIYDIIFKSRQHGFTTEIMGVFLHDTITNEGTNTLIILHKQRDAMKKMQDLKFIFKSIPEEYRPVTEYDTKYEMTFPRLNSSISIAWATEDLGRSQTYHNVLCSEVAFWKCDVEKAMGALAETCQKENGGNLIIESTPNGMGNWFHKEVMRARRGDSAFKLHEYGWWEDPEHSIGQNNLGEDEQPLTDEEKRLMEEEDLTIGQIRWRRRKIQNTPGGKRVFLQEQELSFLQSGTKVFDPSYLHLYAPRTEPKDGYALGVYIYEEPEPGRIYVIGADTAEGLEDGDYHSAHVLDLETGIEVASLHYKWNRDEYARKLDWLGRKYNNALLGVERQNHGHDILGRLQDGRGNKHDKPYPNLYWHKDYDATGKSYKLGWPTTTKTKPIMINELEEALRKNFILLASETTIEELQVYEVKDNGKTGAPEGYHDDRVMSLAIAWQLRKVINVHQPPDEEQDVGVISA